jgi:hypothetical protein
LKGAPLMRHGGRAGDAAGERGLGRRVTQGSNRVSAKAPHGPPGYARTFAQRGRCPHRSDRRCPPSGWFALQGPVGGEQLSPGAGRRRWPDRVGGAGAVAACPPDNPSRKRHGCAPGRTVRRPRSVTFRARGGLEAPARTGKCNRRRPPALRARSPPSVSALVSDVDRRPGVYQGPVEGRWRGRRCRRRRSPG